MRFENRHDARRGSQLLAIFHDVLNPLLHALYGLIDQRLLASIIELGFDVQQTRVNHVVDVACRAHYDTACVIEIKDLFHQGVEHAKDLVDQPLPAGAVDAFQASIKRHASQLSGGRLRRIEDNVLVRSDLSDAFDHILTVDAAAQVPIDQN